ncbi:MAG: LysM peptidoglycan-binding protein [Herminiimonas sp.]|nr:LysM peptidoglycan-binding protein [Herminiimonas sp.]
MHQLKKKAFVCALLLSAGVPFVAHANDISIFAYSPSQPVDPNDPLMQALQTDEIDVWGRIRKGFAIPDLDNPLVTTQTTWYSSRPDYIQRTTTRASRYLYHVVQELEKRNMPMELALLPFIESAFNPQAYSTAKASGMWQFIPSTGRDFNLKQNMFKDERRDVLASTDAALTYLQKLYGMFGDWQLALAAYNWGEGSVQRAINKARAAGGPTDFNGLSIYMPAETRNYVPKLQAVKNIIASPGQYGITLPKVDNQPYFVTINKTRDIDVKVAAQLAELPMDEFKALNPQFNRPVITGSPDTQILLPKNNAEKFKVNLSKWGQALSSWTSHKVTSARERIETIAARFSTTPEVIREVNNIPPRMVLKEGSTILVPRSETHASDITAEVADKAMMAMEPDRPPTRRIHVKVGKRDTLASIAARHRVSVAEIKSWNSLSRDSVAKGQTLELNVPNTVRTASARPKADEGKRVASTAQAARKTGRDEPVRHVVRTKRHESVKVAARPSKTVVATTKQKNVR